MADFDKMLGQQLKKHRKSSGLTQKEVADEIGVSFQQYQKYETGRNRITVEYFLYALHAMGEAAGMVLHDFINPGFLEKFKSHLLTLDNLEAQKSELKRQEKEILDKLSAHKMDMSGVKFVLQQKKLDAEYRKAFDTQVKNIRTARKERNRADRKIQKELKELREFKNKHEQRHG